jgi:hypothetical protein
VKVYVATSGEYSDFRIRQVFARREDAESYPLGDDVMEFEVHEGPAEARTWHTLYWYASQPDLEAGDSRTNPNPFRTTELRDFDGNPRHAEHQWLHGAWAVLTVSGWDPDVVAKVYSEQRAQYVAREQGIT